MSDRRDNAMQPDIFSFSIEHTEMEIKDLKSKWIGAYRFPGEENEKELEHALKGLDGIPPVVFERKQKRRIRKKRL